MLPLRTPVALAAQIELETILQDCLERLLVVGTGKEALERRDPFSDETPLIAQVRLGEYDNVWRLLRAGADANAATAGMSPPLSLQSARALSSRV